ncbi:MAG: hypothetical protein AAF125_02665 [Chloroflexota bacterium]
MSSNNWMQTATRWGTTVTYGIRNGKAYIEVTDLETGEELTASESPTSNGELIYCVDVKAELTAVDAPQKDIKRMMDHLHA